MVCHRRAMTRHVPSCGEAGGRTSVDRRRARRRGGARRIPRHDGGMFLGDDLLAYLALALGGALFAGNLLAVVRPPEQREEGALERAPVGRSLLYAGLGLVVAVWAFATLVAG